MDSEIQKARAQWDLIDGATELVKLLVRVQYNNEPPTVNSNYPVAMRGSDFENLRISQTVLSCLA